VRSFTRQVRPGSVVSLHLGHAGTVAALPTILTALRERGLAALTASDLLGA
jgi:peptidoglycan/xylan/chitin deacetylase (PgdA/CDA1 family)